MARVLAADALEDHQLIGVPTPRQPSTQCGCGGCKVLGDVREKLTLVPDLSEGQPGPATRQSLGSSEGRCRGQYPAWDDQPAGRKF
jgi:hypothetical protein